MLCSQQVVRLQQQAWGGFPTMVMGCLEATLGTPCEWQVAVAGCCLAITHFSQNLPMPPFVPPKCQPTTVSYASTVSDTHADALKGSLVGQIVMLCFQGRPTLPHTRTLSKNRLVTAHRLLLYIQMSVASPCFLRVNMYVMILPACAATRTWTVIHYSLDCQPLFPAG